MSKRVLLVEGESDKRFYSRLCQEVSLNASVTVAPPRGIGGTHDTKGGVFNLLPTLLSQMQDGLIKHLAVSVDADHVAAGGMGSSKTLETFISKVEPLGFSRVSSHEVASGFLFQHNDGLADIGLWVMPDNRMDGMLEDWIKTIVQPGEIALLQRVVDALNDLGDVTKFKPIHRSKAEVSMWLACQDPPGQELGPCLGKGLLNLEHAAARAIKHWLRSVFP